jgi:hypothetical protein
MADKELLLAFCDFLCSGRWVPSLDYECVYAFLAARQPQAAPPAYPCGARSLQEHEATKVLDDHGHPYCPTCNPPPTSDPTKCSRCDAVIGPFARKAVWSKLRQRHEWLCLECARNEVPNG